MAYVPRCSMLLQGIHSSKHLDTERARGWKCHQGERGSSGGHLYHLEGLRFSRSRSPRLLSPAVTVVELVPWTRRYRGKLGRIVVPPPDIILGSLPHSLVRTALTYCRFRFRQLSRRPIAFEKEPYEKERKIVVDEALTDNPYPTWKKLEELVDKGKIRNIGVSK